HCQDDRVRRLPVRSWRSPVLLEAATGRTDVGGDAREGVLEAPTPVTDLLRRKVLRLSDHRKGRRCPARPLGVFPLRPLVLVVVAASQQRRGHLRGLGDVALRPSPLRRFLPVLYGEGLGDTR